MTNDDTLRAALTKLADEWAASSCSGLVEEIRTLLAAHPARNVAAEALCLADTSWEHHDRTDDFPCSSCVSYTRREDVARALCDEDTGAGSWDREQSREPFWRAYWLGLADAVLAALPAPPVVDEAEVRERIAQDIEAQAYDADGARTAISTGECTVEGVDTWDEAMYLAARIARGATR